MQRPAPVALVLATILVAGGCGARTARLTFPSDEVQRLDGLGPGHTVELETTDGSLVPVTSGTMLRFAGPAGPVRKLRCERIEIVGSLLACVNRAGLEERVDLSRGDLFVLVHKPGSKWGTVAWTVLAVYVLAAVVACTTGGCGDR